MKNSLSKRENFLLSLLDKITKEYKTLRDYLNQVRPYKIIEISRLSRIPGESEFVIQITNKNQTFTLSAADILERKYPLDHFSDYHSEMIKKAAQGKLLDFLKLNDNKPVLKIVSKRFDRERQQYIFTLETSEKNYFPRTADEIARDKSILEKLDIDDIYNIGYTHGTESILKEKMLLLMAKSPSSQ